MTQYVYYMSLTHYRQRAAQHRLRQQHRHLHYRGLHDHSISISHPRAVNASSAVRFCANTSSPPPPCFPLRKEDCLSNAQRHPQFFRHQVLCGAHGYRRGAAGARGGLNLCSSGRPERRFQRSSREASAATRWWKVCAPWPSKRAELKHQEGPSYS